MDLSWKAAIVLLVCFSAVATASRLEYKTGRRLAQACNNPTAADSSAATIALNGGNAQTAATAIASAAAVPCAQSLSSAIGAAYAAAGNPALTSVFVTTLAQAIGNASTSNSDAAAQVVAQAGQGNANTVQAFGAALASGLLSGGPLATADAKAAADAIAKYNCSIVQPVLAAANAKATAAGQGTALATAAAQASTVNACLGTASASASATASTTPAPSPSPSPPASPSIPANSVSSTVVNSAPGTPANANNVAIGSNSASSTSIATSGR